MLRSVSSSSRREYRSPRRNSSCAAMADTRVPLCRWSAVRNSQLSSAGLLRSNTWTVSISMPPMRAPAASSSASDGSGAAEGGGATWSGFCPRSWAATGPAPAPSRMANTNSRVADIGPVALTVAAGVSLCRHDFHRIFHYVEPAGAAGPRIRPGWPFGATQPPQGQRRRAVTVPASSAGRLRRSWGHWADRRSWVVCRMATRRIEE